MRERGKEERQEDKHFLNTYHVLEAAVSASHMHSVVSISAIFNSNQEVIY